MVFASASTRRMPNTVPRHLSVAIGAGIGLVFAACAGAIFLSISEHSTPDRVVIEISDYLLTKRPARVAQLWVNRCEKHETVWSIDGTGQDPVSRIEYGVVPSEWITVIEAQPLTPSCYVVMEVQAEPVGFIISDSDVRELSTDEVNEELRRRGGTIVHQ